MTRSARPVYMGSSSSAASAGLSLASASINTTASIPAGSAAIARKHAAPYPRSGSETTVAPCARAELETEAIEVRFVAHDAAEHAVRYDPLHGDEVAGVATLLIDRHDTPLLFRYLDEQAYRYNSRKRDNGDVMSDYERFRLACSQIVGKLWHLDCKA